MRILVVEDDPQLNEVTVRYLKKCGYAVDSAFDGDEALDYFRTTEYDIVLLDIMIPGVHGFSLGERIRKADRDIGILFITAKDQLEDKVKGLESGADDYLVKPFAFEELTARIGAVMRRKYPGDPLEIPLGYGVVLDPKKKRVFRQGNPVELTAKEYEVLEYLGRNKNSFRSKEQIREHVWDYDYQGDSNIIEVLIKNIRKKVDPPQGPSIIVTKRGIGYGIIPK